MFVLLSSAASPRYRHDILRCVAAPINGIVQFRYAKRHCTAEALTTLERYESESRKDEAVICFADNTVQAGKLPLLPVRIAKITAARFHGETISLSLSMQEFICADHETFTQKVVSATKNDSPQKKEKVTGAFCLMAERANILDEGEIAADLKVWEKLVEKLQKFSHFCDERFFWTVLGIVDPKANSWGEEKFLEWKDKLKPSTSRAIQIYHYRPQQEGIPDGSLTIEVGGPVEKNSPDKIEIDSRYDLKRWLFSTPNRTTKTQYGWFRIGVDDEWSLDLPVYLKKSWIGVFWAAIIAGTFMATPTVATFVNSHLSELSFSWGGQPHGGFWLTTGIALVSGWVAAAAILASLPRIRP